MKQCPQCQQIFTDDTHFCLSDGTPLLMFNDAPEELTLVRTAIPKVQPAPTPAQNGNNPVFAYLAGGVFLLLLAVGVIAIAIFALSRNWKNDPANIRTNSNSSNNDDGANQLKKERANLQELQEQFEKEKKRLAEERKRLNDEKNKPTETPLPPLPTPPSTTPFPPQPTARIKFGRGRVAESVSGKIYSQRSFVLEAKSGQYLSASVNGGGCVNFSNGATSLGYVTGSGDNRITLVNNCKTEAGFVLTVSIK